LNSLETEYNINRKFNKWKTWKTNNGGGSAYHIRQHLVKEHYTAYKAACDRIGYTPDENLSLKSNDEDINEPITAEGILRYLTEWFTEDDIVSCASIKLLKNY
jgi:hypothetical protein